ncbi:hypothetical protein DC3_05670 [Deinococcus cellulosilyticus NBRC 106333 = KACC 11606]|uniref:Uncharacterized protein n=1 Tax=Deinococcus cellulosilyticus (strain DSM 18568 / NBRC 106333 / KACC 11606 / 5516J-15) TaxID=1223518 RepID=A0A511MWI2_DEIC1|nr:hypothetical protein DC3_05670 [Deinococcus cellulosilyticus NBRC 106333 = KACC 11606]
MPLEDRIESFYESNDRLYCSKCHQELQIDDEGSSILYLCPSHGLLLLGMSGGKADRGRIRKNPEFIADTQNYILTLLEMPEGKLRTIATIAGLTRKPSWLLREQYLDGQWSFPETFTAQGILDIIPALKQRGLPFRIEPGFPWLDEVPDPETPPPA